MTITIPDDQLRIALLGSATLPNGQAHPGGMTCEVAQALHDLRVEILGKIMSPWLTRQEAAAWARCHVARIDYLARKGEITRYDGTRYLKADIDRCIKQGRFADHDRKPNIRPAHEEEEEEAGSDDNPSPEEHLSGVPV